ncbi:transglutaminase family protein [Rummeliibacillus suwonensis]|uniref:transglutaminase family protein n=1 Tax=Rummeliibacillus suwonensis TaxID=1306154 RepID=UPI001AAF4394|nr:transglutaminase family protein [Rummeliibacillus suwonensis]MBO2534717.1 transglutaminase family protein [Rummeliibacillus suwonensis]
MKYKITHLNTFEYDSPVEQSLNTIRLKPRTNECQRLLFYDIEIFPNSVTREYTDIWHNPVADFYIPQKHSKLEIQTTSIVSIQKAPLLKQLHFSNKMKDIFESQLFRDHYLHYLQATKYTYLPEHYVKEITQIIGNRHNPIEFSIALMTHLHKNIRYDKTATIVKTTAQEAYELKAGVCQDYAHIMIGILRANGIPSRYVSGYLYVGKEDDLIGDSATHAWVEIMVPGVGWLGLDPTNDVEALENHIILCAGRDYTDVSPIEGVYTGGNHTLSIKVKVKKIDHL